LKLELGIEFMGGSRPIWKPLTCGYSFSHLPPTISIVLLFYNGLASD